MPSHKWQDIRRPLSKAQIEAIGRESHRLFQEALAETQAESEKLNEIASKRAAQDVTNIPRPSLILSIIGAYGVVGAVFAVCSLVHWILSK